MMIPISAGRSMVNVKFVEGWDRWLGVGISLVAFVVALALLRSKIISRLV